jgi:hypothetical protein
MSCPDARANKTSREDLSTSRPDKVVDGTLLLDPFEHSKCLSRHLTQKYTSTQFLSAIFRHFS